MKIGIIGPSKLKEKEKVKEIAKIVAQSGNEVFLTPDKGSSSEYFALEYEKAGGEKVYSVFPLKDNEFGTSHTNKKIGEHIDCGTWGNQPERLNKETDILISLGHSIGGIIEIGYTKWFKPKPVYIIKDIDSEKLPKVMEKELEIHYISIDELMEKLK
tara:strand:+ start:676 stop:1149 length:474 start_codon:yes stop_codon:yes gene_type:complete